MRDPSARHEAATVLGNAVGAGDGAGSAVERSDLLLDATRIVGIAVLFGLIDQQAEVESNLLCARALTAAGEHRLITAASQVT
jgi:hypothetical protein